MAKDKSTDKGWMSGYEDTLTGAGIGAGVGGLGSGLYSWLNNADTSDIIRNSLIGAGLGGVTGGAIGYLPKAFEEYKGSMTTKGKKDPSINDRVIEGTGEVLTTPGVTGGLVGGAVGAGGTAIVKNRLNNRDTINKLESELLANKRKDRVPTNSDALNAEQAKLELAIKNQKQLIPDWAKGGPGKATKLLADKDPYAGGARKAVEDKTEAMRKLVAAGSNTVTSDGRKLKKLKTDVIKAEDAARKKGINIDTDPAVVKSRHEYQNAASKAIANHELNVAKSKAKKSRKLVISAGKDHANKTKTNLNKNKKLGGGKAGLIATILSLITGAAADRFARGE